MVSPESWECIRLVVAWFEHVLRLGCQKSHSRWMLYLSPEAMFQLSVPQCDWRIVEGHVGSGHTCPGQTQPKQETMLLTALPRTNPSAGPALQVLAGLVFQGMAAGKPAVLVRLTSTVTLNTEFK